MKKSRIIITVEDIVKAVAFKLSEPIETELNSTYSKIDQLSREIDQLNENRDKELERLLLEYHKQTLDILIIERNNICFETSVMPASMSVEMDTGSSYINGLITFTLPEKLEPKELNDTIDKNEKLCDQLECRVNELRFEIEKISNLSKRIKNKVIYGTMEVDKSKILETVKEMFKEEGIENV